MHWRWRETERAGQGEWKGKGEESGGKERGCGTGVV